MPFKKKGKATKSEAAANMIKMPEGASHSIDIEKISNGFLARHHRSHTDAKGDYHHESHTVFHKKHPLGHARVNSMFKNLLGKESG